jgi:hypothetical protein
LLIVVYLRLCRHHRQIDYLSNFESCYQNHLVLALRQVRLAHRVHLDLLQVWLPKMEMVWLRLVLALPQVRRLFVVRYRHREMGLVLGDGLMALKVVHHQIVVAADQAV